MTSDERNLLQQFLSDLQATRGAQKDQDADALINSALRANPDASYLLVQHAMLADQALQAAQQRIQALEQQAPGPAQTSFLGGGQPVPPPAQGGGWDASPPPQSPLSPGGGLGGFLRGAGMMAAGVAGGEFLAQGVSNLFSPRDW